MASQRAGCQKSGALRSSGDVVAGYGAPSRAAVSLEVRMVWSFVYLALRRVLELMVLGWRSADAKEVEILVLRHQLAVPSHQHPGTASAPAPRPRPARSTQPAPAQAPMVHLRGHAQTLLGWHRRMMRRRWTYPATSSGRPPIPQQVQTLIVRLATDNPRLGLPAHPRRAAASWLPGLGQLQRQSPAQKPPAGAATGFLHVAVVPAPPGSRHRGL